MQPSIFIKQHIGTVEAWLEELASRPEYIEMLNTTFVPENGVIWKDTATGIQLTPSGVVGDLSVENVTPEQAAEVAKCFMQYTKLLSTCDPQFVKAAAKLDESKEMLEQALVREELYPGGTLWLRNFNGIWKIRVLALTEPSDVVMDYEIIDPPTKETGGGKLRFMHLFSSKSLASDMTREGKYNARSN